MTTRDATTKTSSTSSKGEARRGKAEIVRQYRPLDDGEIHGVTFDGKLVWFARDDELVAFDPEEERVVRRFEIARAEAGTAYDGEHLYQIAGGEILVIDPQTGAIVRRLPAPGQGGSSGLAYADGHLWVGQYRASRIHKIDAKTGALVKTLTSDRFVTGVSCVDGALWHATSGDGKTPELRRLGVDGSVEETLEVSVESIHGMERTPDGEFWCAGNEGRLRRVRAST